MTIYAATTNQGKLREFSECAGEQGVEVLALPGMEAMPEPVEDAATFEGNAEKKAVAYSKLALAAGHKGHLVRFSVFGMQGTKIGKKREEDIPIVRRQTMIVTSTHRECVCGG